MTVETSAVELGELEDLRKSAEDLGIKVDGRWGADRLRAEIEAVDVAQPSEVVAQSSDAMSVSFSGQCVAEDGKPHVGRAVFGRVCSYHAMWYRPDGTRRS